MSEIDRRAALGLLGASLADGARRAAPPNVVLLVGDDHQPEGVGAYGSRLAHTPNLDRLAGEGIRFQQAFCNAPICSPSRQSFLTGRYPHVVGVTLLGHAMGDEAYTLAHRLKEAGYRTGAFGKMHFNSKKLYGFDVYEGLEQGGPGGERRPPNRVQEGIPVRRPSQAFVDPARLWLNADCLPAPRYDEDCPSTQYTRRAIEFLRAHRAGPFFVALGFSEPHAPFNFPLDLAGAYLPKDMPVPLVSARDARYVPTEFAPLSHADKQGIVASYYTSVRFLDRNVGRVLAALDELGLREDTLVVYCGDNGYLLGQHGRFEKCCFYEPAVRVPLLMRFPGRIRAGQVSEALVELVDIVPTVLELVGRRPRREAAPRDLHGYSLRPVMEGRVNSVRDTVFSEYQHSESAMVRTRRHKLIYRSRRCVQDCYEPAGQPDCRLELFDLAADPNELENRAGDAALARVRGELLDRLAECYRRFPPPDGPAPSRLTREEFLDWAMAPRNPPGGAASPEDWGCWSAPKRKRIRGASD